MRWHAIGKLMRDHAPSIDFHRFSDSALHTQCYHWIDWIDRPTVKYAYTETVGTLAFPRVCDFQRPTVLLVIDCLIFSDSIISWPYLRQAGAFFGRMVSARREWMPFAHGVVFHIFCWYCDVWINFWSLQKFKTNHILLSGFLSLKRDIAMPQSKMTRPKFRNKVFGYLTKNVALNIFLFLLFRLCQRSACGPKKILFFAMGWTWVAGSTWDLFGARHKSYKLEKFDATFSVVYPKNITWKYFVDLSWMDHPKVLLTE